MPRIVIVGGGFGGLEAAKELGRAGVPATLVDRNNHHLFQPLLYQVATAALPASDIAEPIRKILRRHRSIRVLYGEVIDIDPGGRLLTFADGEKLPYDILVLATGARPSYFGHDEWRETAPGLKTIEEASEIRSRLLLAFELAERTQDEDEKRRLTTFAVIGGGPSGVELAGSIAELSRSTLPRDFRNVRPEWTRVLLIEAGERVLSGFDEALSDFARARLERLGVEVLVGSPVQSIEPDRIEIDGETIPVGLTIWAAGVAASPLAERLGAGGDRSGRVRVGADLQVIGLPGVYALGDVALFEGRDGAALPGLAQVAKQQGAHLGRELARGEPVGAALAPFEYRSRGGAAIIGRHAAVFESERFKLSGWAAWLAWVVIHIYLLVGFQNRVQVSMRWLWRYITHERGARIISGEALRRRPARDPAEEAASSRTNAQESSDARRPRANAG